MLIKDKNDFETAETEQLPPCFGCIWNTFKKNIRLNLSGEK